MDGSNALPRTIVRIGCDEQSEFPEDGSPATCHGSLHLSDARVGPGGNGLLFSGKGGYDGPTGTLPGSTAFPSSSLEKVYVIERSGTGLHRLSTAASGHSATWSPNVATVVFTQKSGDVSNLMKVSGSSATAPATLLLKNASQADWQPVP